MRLYALHSINLGKASPEAAEDTVIAPEQEFDMADEAEALRLIELGAAADPEQRIVASSESMDAGDAIHSLVTERDELLATVAEAKSANEALAAKCEELSASLAAAHAEIDRLTKALAKAEKK